MLKTSLAIARCVASCTCLAGELILDATLVEVANAYGGASFAIKPTGGTGICAGVPWIVFPEAKAKSSVTHKRAIATALLAFSAGKKVRIHNYESDSCLEANFISVSN